MLKNIYNKFRRITSSDLYFPEIDGIRFFAIVLVVLYHIYNYFYEKTRLNNINFNDDPARYKIINSFLNQGDRGVQLFFVLSGFVLCLPFAMQYIKNGKKVVLKKYYLRRLTRLEPPYIIAMTSLFILVLIAKIYPVKVLIWSWLASLFYLHDFIYHRPPLLTVVAWSLEIEIQFYLIAPLLFRVLSLPKYVRRIVLFASILGIMWLQLSYIIPVRCIYSYGQYFFMGILLADLFVCNDAGAIFKKTWMIPVSILLFFSLCFMPLQVYDIHSDPTAIFSYLSFPFLIGLFYYTVLKNDHIKQVFSYKFIPIIGGMCYTIYLLHYTIIAVVGRLTMNISVTRYYLPNLLFQIVILCIPILIISSVYYFYIERPFMSKKWMDKLMKKYKPENEVAG